MMSHVNPVDDQDVGRYLLPDCLAPETTCAQMQMWVSCKIRIELLD